MSKIDCIPIIFGITGHRDLCLEDMPKLKEKLTILLKEYKTTYPHTQIILLSALAQGADMLAAEVAKELGVVLHVVLPYEEKAYLNSFDDEASKELFQSLKNYASKYDTLNCNQTKNREGCYQQLGEYIANTSNILIALWDGVDTSKKGGTSAIVKYMQRGFEENCFDQLNGNALFVINTPRVSNPKIDHPFQISKKYLGKMKENDFKNMLQKIDKRNADLKDQIKDDDIITSFIRYFDKKADKSQSIHKWIMLTILILSWIGVASMESMHVLHIDQFLWGYGIALLMAFGVYHYFIKKRNIKNDFIYSRGIAEALRVQKAYNHAGIDNCITRHYLTNHHHKFTWIKTALKNIYYLSTSEKRIKDDTYIKEKWIKGQITYMENAISLRENRLHRSEKIENLSYRVGFVVLVVLFGWFVLEQFHIVEHGVLPFSWHHLVLVSSLLLMTAAFIGEKYLKIEGYEEDIYNFEIMIEIYKKAQKLLEKTESDSEEYREIILDLGEKALDENSKWVVLHDGRRVEPSLE